LLHLVLRVRALFVQHSPGEDALHVGLVRLDYVVQGEGDHQVIGHRETCGKGVAGADTNDNDNNVAFTATKTAKIAIATARRQHQTPQTTVRHSRCALSKFEFRNSRVLTVASTPGELSYIVHESCCRATAITPPALFGCCFPRNMTHVRVAETDHLKIEKQHTNVTWIDEARANLRLVVRKNICPRIRLHRCNAPLSSGRACSSCRPILL
ncbi:unnamed protein product, partial [Ectocarpus sp. 8 AP-2014]